MLGLFRFFGRSREMQTLDAELRAAGVHPVLVTEAVKLAVLKLLKDGGSAPPPEQATRRAALMLAYCIQDRDAFAESTTIAMRKEVEGRLKVALEKGDSLDARLVLLCMHAGLIAEGVVERFGLEVEE